jgi:hypothetical protein
MHEHLEIVQKDFDVIKGLNVLPHFEELNMLDLTRDEIQNNMDEINLEIDTLKSILMDDVFVHDDFFPTITLPTNNETIDICIYKTVTLTVYPVQSIPAHVTRITSRSSSNSAEDISDSKAEQGVKISISKFQDLPSFEIVVMFPISYPSQTPPLFIMKKHDIFNSEKFSSEKFVSEKFDEIFERDLN